MNTKQLSAIFLVVAILIFHISCKTELKKPFPDKHYELSKGRYEKYFGQLEKAYSLNNNFEIALQLANLKDNSVTFEYLNLAIKQDNSLCDQLYEWGRLYDKHNFGVNLVKLDTAEFRKSIMLCDQVNKNSSYHLYCKMKDEEEKHAKESREIEDSTNFNISLVKELQEIHRVDQEIRNRLSAKNLTEAQEKELRKEMRFIDSINILKIDKIFNEYGYPSKEVVGEDGNFTPALVIHHSNSLETRYKYLPFLEEAVEEGKLYSGTLDMIKRRIQSMELDRK